jgi:sodium transport system permease protein
MMMAHVAVIAGKELRDHLRDRRSLASAALYALMGPAIVLLVLLSRGGDTTASGQPWAVMASIFALMAALTGPLSVAADTIAGERERRCLLPLLIACPSRREVVVGKWLAASVFAAGGLLASVLGFAAVFAILGLRLSSLTAALMLVPAMLSLALLSTAAEILISTLCRTTKEANTYLSMLVFAAMAAAMWIGFRSDLAATWWHFIPMLGHQRGLEIVFGNGTSSLIETVLIVFRSSILTVMTMTLTVVVLIVTWRRLRRDEAVYGG